MMASHYQCGQYNDSFKPSRLRNWCHKTHPWEQCCNIKREARCRPTRCLEFIADDRGHLLPSVKRGRKMRPNWGEPDLRIWDTGFGCGCCEPRNPKFSKPAWKDIPKYFCDEKKSKKLVCPEDKPAPPPIPVPEIPLKQHIIDFNNIKGAQPPVIWVYGQFQSDNVELRTKFCHELADRLGYTYIDLDKQVAKWGSLDPQIRETLRPSFTSFYSIHEDDYENVDENLQRCISFSKRLIQEETPLSIDSVLELVKMAMIEAWPTKGYVLQALPGSKEEAKLYEEVFWESAGGVYFSSSKWTNDKSEDPPIQEPRYLIRQEKYSEKETEETCDLYGYKTVKVIHTEEIGLDELTYVNEVVDCFISYYPQTLQGKYEVLIDHCKAKQLPGDSTSEDSSSGYTESSSDSSEIEYDDVAPIQEPNEALLGDAAPIQISNQGLRGDAAHIQEPNDALRGNAAAIEEPNEALLGNADPGDENENAQKEEHANNLKAEDESGSGSESDTESSDDEYKPQPDVFKKPSLIETFNTDLFPDEKPKPKRKATPGGIATTRQPVVKMPVIRRVTRKTKASPAFREAPESTTDEDEPSDKGVRRKPQKRTEKKKDMLPQSESSSSLNESDKEYILAGERIEYPKAPDDEYNFIPYIPEITPASQTIHAILPSKKKLPNLKTLTGYERAKLLDQGPRQTLQEKIDLIFRPDETWIEVEDEQRRRDHVPLICCFDKKKQALNYRRTRKALEGWVEPPKISFGTRCKNLFNRIVVAMTPKEEVILSANEALALWYKEHPEDDIIPPPMSKRKPIFLVERGHTAPTKVEVPQPQSPDVKHEVPPTPPPTVVRFEDQQPNRSVLVVQTIESDSSAFTEIEDSDSGGSSSTTSSGTTSSKEKEAQRPRNQPN